MGIATGGKLEERKAGRLGVLFYAFLLLLYYATLFFLFYRQQLFFPNQYASDLPLQIQIATGEEHFYNLYSLIYLFFRWASFLGNAAPIVIAAVLATFPVMTIVITYYLLKHLTPSAERWLLWSASWLVNFATTIYIPEVTRFYRGGWPGTLWHNPPYIAAKPFALLALLFFVKIKQEYLDKKNWKNWILFAGALLLGTIMKPSFFIAFAPAMLILLIIDFIKTKGRSFWRNVWFGCGVLPSVAVCIWQSNALFGMLGGGNQAAQDSGITLVWPSFATSAVPNLLFSRLVSLLLPLLVLYFLWYWVKRNMAFPIMPMTAIFALITALFFKETGPRSSNGNFAWSGYTASYLFFVFAVSVLIDWQIKEPTKSLSRESKRLRYILWGMLGLYVISGLYYYVYLLAGGDFFV